MFAEELILGTEERIIDENKRIIMPKFTKAEKGEILLATIEGEKGELLRLISFLHFANAYQKVFQDGDGDIYLSKNKADLEELRNWGRLLSEKYFKTNPIDNQGRICLGQAFDKLSWKPKDVVKIIGEGESIVISKK